MVSQPQDSPEIASHYTSNESHEKEGCDSKKSQIFNLLVVRYWVLLAGVRFKAPFRLSCAGFRYSSATVQGALCACEIKTHLKDLVKLSFLHNFTHTNWKQVQKKNLRLTLQREAASKMRCS